ncbi:MAG TPA: c-type cytochrome [Anaerolineales bacterium]|nr:c-type cytochrome [Anaerolineales bacterium]
MNDQERQDYRQKYHQQKEHGVPFFPDILFKDAVVSFVVFIVLIGLAYFVGAPLEDRANPGDASYTPRPEWYFLFLFQLLKYFPGNLEVIGVFILPTLAVALLVLLPWLDRSPRRYPIARPVVTGVTAFGVLAVVGLTLLSVAEAPPPAQTSTGDTTAALYASNCAACHGPSIEVEPGANLHEIIAFGRHEGMPAWSSDLTTDQIDALAGFILSPAGSRLFTQECGSCHEAPELVAGDPVLLKDSLALGSDFEPHAGLDVPVWHESLAPEERTALLNFLAAPDGQRLFATNCSSCHGRAVAFSGDRRALESIIREGGLHLDMPSWRERLSPEEIDILTAYVVDPELPEGRPLFQQYCAACHGARVPAAATPSQAREIISSGGPHQTMPVWGDILTPEQIEALTAYALEAGEGAPVELGAELFATNCATCHGDFGEGGANPTRPGDVIAPISSAEYLKTRDDSTLRAIIAQGQPNFGMSPFGTAYGGPLDDPDIDAIVAFLRSWELSPPVELPPEVATTPIAVSGAEIYADVCAQCHGPIGEGGLAVALSDSAFQERNTDEDLYNSINLGHDATAMIGWGEILSADQIRELVAFIRQLGGVQVATTPSGAVSFRNDVFPILQANCGGCHGTIGGWDASTYDRVINSGSHGPAVVPGNVDASLLADKLLGTHTQGTIMPPGGALPFEEIETILNWIAAGAPNN